MTIKNSLKKLCKKVTGVDSTGSTIREVIDDIDSNFADYVIEVSNNGNISESSIPKIEELFAKYQAGKFPSFKIKLSNTIITDTCFFNSTLIGNVITIADNDVCLNYVSIKYSSEGDSGSWNATVTQKILTTTDPMS